MAALTADELLQLGRGFMESRILLTGAELDVFTRLANRALSAQQLAGELAADLRGLTILLDALCGIGVLAKRDGKYRCEVELACYLAATSEASIVPMLRHSVAMWRRWSQLTDIVRGTARPDAGPRSPEDQRAFIGAMDVVSRPLAAAIAVAIGPQGARALLDIGAGPGTYTLALLHAAPELRATVFDLPAVIEMARERFVSAGLAERVTFVAGDFYVDELPGGHDLVLLSAIIHQNSRAQNVELYRKVWRGLVPGGRLIVRDHVLMSDRTRPRAAAVFAVNMLVGTEGGNCYTFDEIREDLGTAGFEPVRLMQQGEQMVGLVEAFRPVGSARTI